MATKLIGLPGHTVPYSAQRPVLNLALNQAFREPLQHGSA
jgi:hypothetical protein